MDVRVRLAGLDDSGTLACLRRCWAAEQVGEDPEDPAFEAAFTAWYVREHDVRLTWLAETDQDAVGMLNMLVYTRMPKPAHPARRTWSRQWGYVANAYVVEERRNAGVGRVLLDAALAHARENDFARVVLSPGQRSVPFYERAGFRPATDLLVHPLE